MISSINNLQKIINLNFKNIIYFSFILIFIDVYLIRYKEASILIINSTNFLEYLGTAHFLIILFATYTASRIIQFLIVLVKSLLGMEGLDKDDLAYSNDNNFKAISLLTVALIFYEITMSEQTQTLINFLLSCKYVYLIVFGFAAMMLFIFGLSHNNS
ncbi:hypothetical protein [Marinilabilia salmonicolor]|uniref:Uncharacterized protein n=1 Tax=Marinilabilia salmonicolor TaxID=989 RepID=A0A368VC41_9BACT|nr:hypothetical protein [Marinilabilia salmonicolor]RCW38847.1 hypothetical protein DFO77_1021 [Marinilabilia salmonicolor]